MLLLLAMAAGLITALYYIVHSSRGSRQQEQRQAWLRSEFRDKVRECDDNDACLLSPRTRQLVVITGGSSGLGKEVARQLADAEAIVVLVARGKDLLESARAEIVGQVKGARVYVIVADVTDAHAAAGAMDQAALHHPKGIIYALFCCAGAAKPGFFTETAPSTFAQQMSLNYGGAVNCAHPVVKALIRHRVGGRIVLISSTLGLTGMTGYSPYAPSKFALRGLAECLRQELLPHGIRVHIYFVATIASPGHEEENRTKPAITKKIEEGDTSDPSPSARARTLLAGITRGAFFISSDHITDIFMAAALGSVPSPSWLWDVLVIPWAHWGLAIWRSHADRLVLQDHDKRTAVAK